MAVRGTPVTVGVTSMTVGVTPVPVVTVVTLWHTKKVQQEKKRGVNRHSDCA